MKDEKHSVYIVDDIQENLQVIASILKENNLSISFSMSGEQALSGIPKVMPDLILLDISMPGMDGYEVCRQLKGNNKTKDIPIIFLTAKTQTEDIVKGFKMGAIDYVTKPFNSEELLSRVFTNLELKVSREKLKLANIELHELNTELDKKVEERTNDLEKAHADLAVALKKEQKLSELKSAFINTISHEYRTPLTIISTSAMLINTIGKKLNTEMLDSYVEKINISVKAMTQLLQDILNYKNIDEGNIQISKSEFDIVSLVKDIAELIQTLDDSKHNFIFELPDSSNINSDKELLRQVLTPIMKNAVKFSESGSYIIISLYESKGEFAISIKDHGIGISEKDLPEIFTPFFKANNTIGIKEGTGLGLAIAKEYIDVLGGTIEVQSIESEGSNFTVRLLG